MVVIQLRVKDYEEKRDPKFHKMKIKTVLKLKPILIYDKTESLKTLWLLLITDLRLRLLVYFKGEKKLLLDFCY